MNSAARARAHQRLAIALERLPRSNATNQLHTESTDSSDISSTALLQDSSTTASNASTRACYYLCLYNLRPLDNRDTTAIQ